MPNRAGTPRNRAGAATRARLVRTAERLFAAHGVDAVSVRAVNAAAGLGPSSVNYHFGTKDDLIAAVLLDLGAALRDRIRANADRLAALDTPPTAEALVRAVTEPYRDLLLRHRIRGMRWVKIVTQLSLHAHPALTAAEADLPERLLAQLRRAFPHSDPERLDARWAVALMGFLQALARADDWHPGAAAPPAQELAALYEDQVVFLIGGLERLLGDTKGAQ
ncbi:TetR/AcrR family transcriptional regulator [Nocardia yunnanensis]|uniref:TetR/AcrR family transcriptional regulator n=2 Tax=Nocardia yunnanensis TaxID=2382165 RepID=A0A386ZD78_9NOCA|nr:TetR/AcrR family transcriptional regulator [Nocardia yunnanensis]AYF75822.1 TetR/AcrR family transcriptional regulator [Nocardia yunnanensis]